MRLEEEQMIRQIMDTETVGYAYVYSADNKTREDYMIALTPENLANLIEGERTVLYENIGIGLWFQDRWGGSQRPFGIYCSGGGDDLSQRGE